MVLHIFVLNPRCCPTAVGRGLAALLPQGHAGGNNAFPQENQAFTPFFQCRRRPFACSRTRRLFTRNGIFAVSRRGCSQRYPHPGYAQNDAWISQKASVQPVDRNGDSGSLPKGEGARRATSDVMDTGLPRVLKDRGGLHVKEFHGANRQAAFPQPAVRIAGGRPCLGRKDDGAKDRRGAR